MSELKKCPFCGNNNIEIYIEGNSHTCYCEDCGTENTESYEKQSAINWWNTRPLEDALIAERDLLRQQLEMAKEALKKYANQDNWRPLLNQELGEHKLFIYSGCTPNNLYAGKDAFDALKQLEAE